MIRRVTVVLTLLFVTAVRGLIPSEETCVGSLEGADAGSLQTSLTPCAFGASDLCCSNLVELVGFDSDSGFGGCLCNKGVLDGLIDELEANELAQRVGFDGDRLLEIFSTCEAPFHGTSACAAEPRVSPEVDIEVDGVTAVVVGVDSNRSRRSGLRAGLRRRRKGRNVQSVGVQDGARIEKADLHNKRRLSTIFELPDPENSTTFEDIHAKLDLIKKNLQNTKDVLLNSAVDKTEALVDHKTRPVGWHEDKTILRNGEIVKLVPAEEGDFVALYDSLPVGLAVLDH